MTVPRRFRCRWGEEKRMDHGATGCSEDVITLQWLQWALWSRCKMFTLLNISVHCITVTTVITPLQHSGYCMYSKPSTLRIKKSKQGAISGNTSDLYLGGTRLKSQLSPATLISSRFPTIPTNAKVVPKFRSRIFLPNPLQFNYGLWPRNLGFIPSKGKRLFSSLQYSQACCQGPSPWGKVAEG